MKTVTATFMDYNEFNKLVVEKLGLPVDFEIVAACEWNNYEDHAIEVDADDIGREQKDLVELYELIEQYQSALTGYDKDPLAFYVEKSVREQLKGSYIETSRKALWDAVSFGHHLLMTALVDQGHLPLGTYVIKVFW